MMNSFRDIALTATLVASFHVTPSAQAATINFDNLSAGTAVTTLQGVTFGSTTGLGLVVSNQFDTTSSPNYLGVDDGGSQLFLAGDTITFDFAAPVVSFNLNVVSTPNTPDAAFVLDGGVAGSDTSAAPTSMLPSGTEVFLLTVASSTPFSSASLSGEPAGIYSFNIDDISFKPASAVPEPSTLLLLGPVLVLFAFHRRRSLSEEKL
jgi:hypothetical protein